jgi:hypothetical protein
LSEAEIITALSTAFCNKSEIFLLILPGQFYLNRRNECLGEEFESQPEKVFAGRFVGWVHHHFYSFFLAGCDAIPAANTLCSVEQVFFISQFMGVGITDFRAFPAVIT